MTRFFPLLILALVTPTAAQSQDLTRLQREGIEAVFTDLSDAAGPGASVAVIRHGEVVYSSGFGSAQLEYGIPIEANTIFHVASVSKQFAAMAVLLLEADGKLSLDDDIRTHMPEVPDMGATVTVRHLLHHTSGVRDQWELLRMAGWRMDDVITKEHVRRMLRNQRELNFEPGAEYLYSNMGFSMLADLVERVSGQPFSEFANDRIFSELGMSDTHVHDDHEMIVPRRAYSYAAVDDGYKNRVLSFANHGATSLFTTAEDLVTWMDNFRTEEIGGAAVLERMKTRGILNGGDTISYALGLAIGSFRGTPTVGHGGSDAGFRSQVSWFPEHELGVAVLSNLASGNPGARARRVAAAVLGDALEPVPAEPEAPAPAPEERAEIQLDEAILNRYAGHFSTAAFPIVFEVRDGSLWVTSPVEIRFPALSETEFLATDGVATITFHVRDGAADSLTVAQGGQTIEGHRVMPREAPDLSVYPGTYYSPEIETVYEIRQVDDGLAVYHLRFGEMELTAGNTDDTFAGRQSFLRQVRFTRNGAGDVDGFRLTGGRVRNLRFVKQPDGLVR